MKTWKIAVASFASLAVASWLWIGGAMAQQTEARKPGEAQQRMDPGQFARGAKLWAANCAQCHNPRDPKDFRDDQWKVIMNHMRIRSGLTGWETRDILLFLQASN